MLSWFKKRKISKAFSHVNGYHKLLRENRPEYIAQLRNDLANNTLNGIPLNKVLNSPKEICFHQFLVYRLVNIEFNKAILSAINHPNKKVYYPLPRLWREILRKKGFKVPAIYNAIAWIKFNIKWYFVGIATGVLEFFRISTGTKIWQNENAAFFENLYPNNLVQSKDKNAQTILDWFCFQEEGKAIHRIFHSCKDSTDYKINDKKVIYKNSAIPPIDSVSKLFKFIFWFIYISFVSLFSQQNRLLFRQLIFEKLVKISSKKEIHKYYLFHNSGHLLRPLWTYVAEKMGSQIIFYFYSTNVSSFKVKDKAFIQDFQWQVVSWSNYWVWNKGQEDFLKLNVLKEFKAITKGIIPFSISNKTFDLSKYKAKPFILIFDVQPFNENFYASVAPSVDFYSSKNMITFLDWIDQLAIKNNVNIVIKRKRENPYISKDYSDKLNALKQTHLWDELSPTTDSIFACKSLSPLASISIPYTSTALVSKTYNIPTVYLDPTQMLDPDFKINNDIPLISSKEELFKWFKSINKKSIIIK